MAIELATAYISILPEVSKVAPGVKKALAATDREFESAGKKSGGLFSKMVGANLMSRAITSAATTVGSGIGAAFTKGLGRLEAIDTAQGKLRGLGHDARSVQTIMDSALAAVKGTAFGLGDAATVAASVVASGIKPGRDLERTLKLVGDAATIGGSSMSEMGAIFAKVSSTGKVQGDVLNQLGDRGIPIISLLAKEMGVAESEVAELAAKGRINFATFQNAIEKGMGGAALESGKTFRGALDNVGAAVGRLGANFMEPVFKQLPSLFSGAISGLDGLSAAATRGGQVVGDALGTVVRGVQGVWSILAKGDFIGPGFTFGFDEDSKVVDVLFRIRDAASDVGAALLRMWQTLQPLGGALLSIAAVLAPLVLDLAKMAGAAVIGALVVGWKALQATFDAVVPVIASVAGWMRENDVLVRTLGVTVLAGVGAWKAYTLAKTAWLAVTTGIPKILAAAKVAVIAFNTALKANPIGLVVTALMALGAGLVYAYQNSETFRNIVNGVWAGIRTVVGAVVDWFVNVVAPFFVGLWGTLSSGAGSAASGMTSAWQGVKDFFSGLWEGVKSIFSTALDFLAGLFFKFHPLGLIIAHWEPIVGFFSGLWDRVSGAFLAGLDAIWGVVGPWVNWFMGVFKAAWGVLEFLIALPVRLAQLAVMAAWGLIKDAFQAAWTWVSGTFMGWWRTIAPLIDGVMSTVRAGIDTAWKWITDRFQQAWAWISGPFMAGYRLLSGLIDAVMTAVRNGIGVAWQWIQDRFQQAWAWVSGTFMGWWRQLTGLIDGVFTLVRNAIGAGWQWIQDRFSQAWTWVSGTFMGWWRSLTGLMETPIRLAREAIDGVLDGIKSGFERAVDFVRDTWDRIKEIVSAPVRVAIKVGNALISGFRTVAKAVGLDDIAGKLVDIPPLPAFAGGGRANIVPGSRSRGVDSTLAVTGRGVPIARVDPGEGIVRYGAMRSLDRFHPGAFDYINKHGMLPGFFQGGRLPTPGPVRPHGLPYYGARYAADMGLGTGSPVYAWNPGTVSQTMLASTSYGNRVRINHDGGLGQTLYAHLSRILVAAGDVVKAGQKIGEVGYSGNVRPPGPGGAHLHFEILGGNAPISASGAAQGESSGFFDWVGDLAGKFAGPLKDLAGIGSSPVAEIIKAIPKMVADGMLGKVKGAATSLMDSVSNFGANVATTAMSGTTLLPQMFAIAKSWGLDRRIAHIMGITMMQEASGRLDFTPDSNSDVGPFQQRTPRDGTIEQLNNLEYAMRTFLYGTTARPGNGDRGGYHVPGLFDKNWRSMGLGQAAQAVQVSAFPSYYDKHIPLVDRMLNAFKYDDGGVLQPGWTLARNDTGKPEAILTQPQWQTAERALVNAGNQFPSELVVRDVDGALVGRMRVEAQSALADSYARVGGR